MNLFKFKISLMFIFLMLSACSRPEQKNNSQVTLNFGDRIATKASSLSECTGVCLYHVILNISGPGLTKIDKSFSARDGSLANSTVKIELSSGSDRLIQVMAVYKDSATGSMQFHYGESLQTLASGEQNVYIDLIGLNVTNSEQGQIAGRYLGNGSVPNFPTGELRVQYRPPGGRPPMTIEKSSMVLGWFTAFSIKGLNFDYIVRTISGTDVVVFENTNFDQFTAANHLLKIRLPAHLDSNEGSSLEEPVNYVYGFFGSSTLTASKYVCYPSSSTIVFDRFLDPITLSPKVWGDLTKAGGVSSFSNCGGDENPPLQNPDYIKALPIMLTNGKSSSGGFYGAFSGMIDNNNYSLMQVNPGSFNIRIVPGAQLIFDKAILYTFSAAAGEKIDDEKVPCESFAQGQFDAKPRGEVNFTAGNTVLTGTNNITAADSVLYKAICPSYQGRVYNGGVFQRGSEGGGAWPSPTPVAASGFDIQGPHKISAGQCHVFGIKLKDGSNYSAIANVAKNISLSLNSVTGVIHTNATCSSSGSTITVPVGSGYQEFSVMTSGGSSQGSLDSTTNDFGNIARYLNFEYTNSPGAENDIEFLNKFQYSGPLGECRPIEFFVVDFNGYPTALAADRNFAIVTSTANLGVYNSCADVTALSNYNLTAGNFKAQLYVKVLGAVPNDSFIDITHSTLSSRMYYNVSSGLNFLTVQLKKNGQFVSNSQLMADECYEVQITANQSNASTLTLESRLIANNGLFHAASNCPGAISSIQPFSINPGQIAPTGGPIYFKAVPGIASIQFDQMYNPIVTNPQSHIQLNNVLFDAVVPSGLMGWFRSSTLFGAWNLWDGSVGNISYSGATTAGQAGLLPYGNNVLQFGASQPHYGLLATPSLTPLTVSILMKPYSFATTQNILKFNHNGTFSYLKVDASGTLFLDSTSTGLSLTANNWYYISLKRAYVSSTQSNWSISINGGAWSGPFLLTGPDHGGLITEMYLGSSPSMHGEVAEVLLYGNELSNSDNQLNYNLFRNTYQGIALP